MNTIYKAKHKIRLLIDNTIRKIIISIPNLYSYKNNIIIIRTDNIGDYILFRNFLPFIRNSVKYRNKQITLVGNIAWRELAEHFDKSYVDNFIWISPIRHNENRFYRLLLYYKIRQMNGLELINTVHSINQLTYDFAFLCHVKTKLSCQYDDTNKLSFTNKNQINNIFDTVIPSLPNTEFEFFRNKTFIENWLGEPISIESTYFEGLHVERSPLLILIFPSAQSSERRWSPIHFSQLIQMIVQHTPSVKFEILGSKKDFGIGEQILKNTCNSSNITNLCGHTTTLELVYKIAACQLLISNETSAVHIAAAVGTQTLCIANGERFGRFSPYPSNMNNHIDYIFPNDSFEKKENWSFLNKKLQYGSDFDINTIKPETVLTKVISILINEENTKKAS